MAAVVEAIETPEPTAPVEAPPDGAVAEPPPPAPVETPAEPPPVAAEPAIAREPWTVPGPKYRQTQRELREVQAEYQRFKQEMEPLKGQVATFEQELAKSKEDREQYETLLAVLEANPELRRGVLDGAAQLPGGVHRTRPSDNGKGQYVKLAPETEKHLEKVGELVETISRAEKEERQRVTVAQRQQRQAEVHTQVETYLRTHKYDPMEKIDPTDPEAILRDEVIDFLVNEAERMGGLERDDVPHVLNRWLAREMHKESRVLAKHTTRKTEAVRVAPPAAPPVATPVTKITDKLPALGTREHKDDVRQWLRERGFTG